MYLWLRSDLKAHLCIAARNVESCRSTLAKAEREMVDAGMRAAAFHAAREGR